MSSGLDDTQKLLHRSTSDLMDTDPSSPSTPTTTLNGQLPTAAAQPQPAVAPTLARKPSLFRSLTAASGLGRVLHSEGHHTAALKDKDASASNNAGASAGLKGNLGSIRRRPHLGSIRQRLSGVFSSPDTPRIKKEEQDADEDFYYRPVPFSMTAGETRTLYLIRNVDERVEVRDGDKVHVLYSTNLPGKADKRHPPEAVVIESTEHDPSKARSPVLIYKHKGEVVCQIKGLTPIRFYKGKPDCVLRVDCFETSQVVRPVLQAGASTHNGRALSNLSVNATPVSQEPSHSKRTQATASSSTTAVDAPGSTQSLKYAWKHTSVYGKGGLKLVDLLDGEVLAYYEPLRAHGRSFARIQLQGSGLHAMKLVIATSLAIRAKNFLTESDEQAAQSFMKQHARAVPVPVAAHVAAAAAARQAREDEGKVGVPPVPAIAPRWTQPGKQQQHPEEAQVSAAAEQHLFSVQPAVART